MGKENCVYRFIDKSNKIIYIGKARILDTRISAKGHKRRHLPDEYYNQIVVIEYIEFENENDMDFAERYYIQKYKPIFNTVSIDKEITMDVPKLDTKIWLLYSVDNKEVMKQLNSFSDEYIIKHSENYQCVHSKFNIDFFDLVLLYIFYNNDYVKKHILYEDYKSKNELYKLKDLIGYENLEVEHETYKNIARLNKIAKTRNELCNEFSAFRDTLNVKYPLLQFNASYITTIQDVNQIFNISSNKFRFNFMVYGRYGVCSEFYCDSCNESNKCKDKTYRIKGTLIVECT